MTARSVAAAVEGRMHLAPACLAVTAAGSDLLQVAKHGAGQCSGPHHTPHAIVALLLNFGAPDCS